MVHGRTIFDRTTKLYSNDTIKLAYFDYIPCPYEFQSFEICSCARLVFYTFFHPHSHYDQWLVSRIHKKQWMPGQIIRKLSILKCYSIDRQILCFLFSLTTVSTKLYFEGIHTHTHTYFTLIIIGKIDSLSIALHLCRSQLLPLLNVKSLMMFMNF